MDINILVVDDEKEIADLVEIYLVSDGYTVFKANNAEDGLAIIEKEEIHLAILDIMMPGMDGLEMCKRIRETYNFPIILLSLLSCAVQRVRTLIRYLVSEQGRTTMLQSLLILWSLQPE